jgi:hypothetical protein
MAFDRAALDEFLRRYEPAGTPAEPAVQPRSALSSTASAIDWFLSTYEPPPTEPTPGRKPQLLPFVPPPSSPARPSALARIPPPPPPQPPRPLAVHRPAVEVPPPVAAHLNREERAEGLRQKALGQMGGAPLPTEQADTAALYGEPTFPEAAVEAWQRGVSNVGSAVGGLGEMVGRALQPEPDESMAGMTLAQQEAMARARDLYSVGAPPMSAVGLAAGATGSQLQQAGEQMQSAATRSQESMPRPEYAQDFWSGLQTDPLKTLAISGLENLPTLVATIGGAAVGGPVGGGAVAFTQEAGAAYNEAKDSGATEEEARRVAGWVGATNMVLEYLPAGKLLRTLKGGVVPGVDDAAAKSVVRLVLEQGMAEGGTESLQELNQILANVAQVAAAEDLSLEDVARRVGEAGISGFVLGLAGGGASVAPRASAGPAVEPAYSPVVPIEPAEPVTAAPVELQQPGPSPEEPPAQDRRSNLAMRRQVQEKMDAVRDLPDDQLRAILDNPPDEATERAVERIVWLRAKGTHAGPPAVGPQVPPTRVRTSEELEVVPAESRPLRVFRGTSGREFEPGGEFPEEAFVDSGFGPFRAKVGWFTEDSDRAAEYADTPPVPGRNPRKVFAGSVREPGRLLEIDAGGRHHVEDALYPRGIEQALAEGRPGVRFRNVIDAPNSRSDSPPQNVVALFSPDAVALDRSSSPAEPAAPTERAVEPAEPQSAETRVVALAQRLGRRPKLPEIQRALGVGYGEARRLWKASEGWDRRPASRATVRAEEETNDSTLEASPEQARGPERSAPVELPAVPDARPVDGIPGAAAAESARSVQGVVATGGATPENKPRPGVALPSRAISSVGERGALTLPALPGRAIKRFLVKNFASPGKRRPKFLDDAVLARDGKIAKHTYQVDLLSRQLNRQIRQYRGPLSYQQLTRYLDDAYRGMNVRTGGELLDDAQIKRIAARRGLQEETVREQASRTMPEPLAGATLPRASNIQRSTAPGFAVRAEAPDPGAQSFLPIIRQLRAHTDGLTRELRRLGALDDGTARELERSHGLYVHRQYESARNDKWAKRVRHEPLWNRAFELTRKKWDAAVAEDRARSVVKDMKLTRPPATHPPRQGDRVKFGSRVGNVVQVVGDKAYVVAADANGKPETVEVPYADLKQAKGTREQAVADLTRALRDPLLLNQFLADYNLHGPLFLGVHDGAVRAHPAKPDSQIWGMLDRYVKKVQRPVMPGGVPEGAKNLSVMKKRGDRDALERLLRGETRHAGSNFATTALEMGALLENERFLRRVEKEGRAAGALRTSAEVEQAGSVDEQTFTEPIDPDRFARKVESAEDAGPEPGLDRVVDLRGKPRTKPMSGLYTTPEVLEELESVFSDSRNYPGWIRWWFHLSFGAKAAVTAGSIQAADRNFLSNFLSVLANGVNPINYDRFKRAGAVSYGKLLGTTEAGRVRLIERMLELNLFDQGTDLGDLKRTERNAQMFKGEEPGAGSAFGRGVRFTQNFYNAPDNFAKMYTFDALVPQYEKALGVTRAEAEEHVAEILRDTMQNYSRVPEAMKVLGQAPVIGPFVSFFEEVARTSKNIGLIAVREIRSDNPEVRKLGAKKAVGFVAALSIPTIAALAARHLLSLDEDDDDAARRFMAPWNRNSTVIFLPSDDGKIRFVDVSFGDFFNVIKQPFIQLLQGDVQGAIEEFKRPFGEDLFTGAVVSAYFRNQTPEGYPVYNERWPVADREIAKAGHVGKTLVPGTLKTAARIADEKRNTADEVIAVFGPRLVTIDIGKQLKRLSFGYKRDVSEGREIEKKPIKLGKDASDRDRRLFVAAVRESATDMVENVRAARVWGLSEEQIDEAMAIAGVGVWERDALLAGDVDQVVEHYEELNSEWVEGKKEERAKEKDE